MSELELCPEGHECGVDIDTCGLYEAFVACPECGYRGPAVADSIGTDYEAIAIAKHNALMRSAREAKRLREGIEQIRGWSMLEHRNEDWLHARLRALLAGDEDKEAPGEDTCQQ